jgi:hypothetical protein
MAAVWFDCLIKSYFKNNLFTINNCTVLKGSKDIMVNSHQKTLRQIKLWAWAATVLPTTSLAALFFIRIIGLENVYYQLLVAGATFMFGIAVVWWWWAIYAIAKVTEILDTSSTKVDIIVEEIENLKEDIKQVKDQ